MKKLPIRTLLPAALVAAVLVGTASTSPLGGGPILTGECILLPPVGDPNCIAITLIETGSGEFTGYGRQCNVFTGDELTFEITSYEIVGDMVCVAGPITSTDNPAPQFAVGNTTAYCILDNGNGGAGAPDSATAGQGPPGLTIQDILGIFGPPPPEAFAPAVSGNFKIH